MTTHTPGPWLVDYRDANGSKVVITRESVPICAVHPKVQTHGLPTAEPNARLIAAAPEMLEALKTAQAEIVCSIGYMSAMARKNFQAVLDQINAALKKAEGTVRS